MFNIMTAKNLSQKGRESVTFDAELERLHKEKERTSLHHAVLCDDVFKLNKLLDERADPNAQVIQIDKRKGCEEAILDALRKLLLFGPLNFNIGWNQGIM